MTQPQTYAPGPCEVWPVRWPASCDLTGVSPEITGVAAQAASEILFYATAQRFGLCTVALRPCRDDCYSAGWPGWQSWWQYGTYPQPYWYNGVWYNMGCGQCTSGCSCVAISETWLPGPVASIVSVTVDGVVLTPGVDYRVDDYRKLVRLGGDTWPYCNDLSQTAVTGVGSWEVVAQYGETVPMLGELAMGELACEFVNLLMGNDCGLPIGVTDIQRQGVSMTLANATTDWLNFFQRHPISYMFIKTFNPHGLYVRSRAFDLDGNDYRAVNT
jgi:hypothetical protein